jgi:hypothetical protein
MTARSRTAAAVALLLGTVATGAAASDTIPFVSDATWDVYDGDPASPPVTLLGKATPVCLNASAPNPCPAGATVYGASNAAGWLADLGPIPGAQWVWAPGVAGTTAPAELAQFFFARTFDIPGPPIGCTLSIAADDLAEVLVNGVSAGVVGSITDSIAAAQTRNMLTTIDIGKFLVEGMNTIVVRGRNGPPGFVGCEPGPCTYSQDPAGVVFGGTLAFGVPNHPPDCDGAFASPGYLWPPSHTLATVVVRGVTDPDGDAVHVTITGIAQDEPVNDNVDGDACPDASGVGTSTAAVRVERDGGGDGRVYHITFVADDGVGGQCTGQVEVCVPHDRGNGSACIDGGPRFDSTGPCDGCSVPGSCNACPRPWSCSDGDPCTIDVCTAGGCVHEPATGLWGCHCFIDDHQWRPPVCGGQPMPQGLDARLGLARQLVDSAGHQPRGGKLVKKAVKQLRKATELVIAARRKHELHADCAVAITVRIRTARKAASDWLRSSRARSRSGSISSSDDQGGGRGRKPDNGDEHPAKGNGSKHDDEGD